MKTLWQVEADGSPAASGDSPDKVRAASAVEELVFLTDNNNARTILVLSLTCGLNSRRSSQSSDDSDGQTVSEGFSQGLQHADSSRKASMNRMKNSTVAILMPKLRNWSLHSVGISTKYVYKVSLR